MKKVAIIILCFIVFQITAFAVASPLELSAPSAVLMERDTGKILFEKDSHKKLPPASVTKVMTLLLVTEALDSNKIKLEDMVPVSEYAASMGGSQVFLAPGEEMPVSDMLKATVIASGNDSAVALAEFIAGSEESFVALMNEKAQQLGMNDTTFKNCTGLDTPGHETSAYDIALMSRELIKHGIIKNYTTIWMDTLRNGTFQLANTNKLIRSYKGITGLKTGSTSAAKFCLSATAERDGMELIATVMAAPSGKERFADASKLLDFGFANYSLYKGAYEFETENIPVTLGTEDFAGLEFGETPSVLAEKSVLKDIHCDIDMPESINAPVKKGQKIGSVKILTDSEILAEIPIISSQNIEKLGIFGVFKKLFSCILMA